MQTKTNTIYVVCQEFRGNISLLKAFWTESEAKTYEQHEWDTDSGLASFDIMEVEIDVPTYCFHYPPPWVTR